MTIKRSPLAVLIVHGMGMFQPGFHEPFERRIRKRLSVAENDRVFVEGCLWDPITQPMQNYVYAKLLPHRPWYNALHRFTIDALGDPVSYLSSYEQNALTTPNGPSFYQEIHDCVLHSLARLETRAGSDAPLMILAHSLGSVIVTNYKWDVEHRRSRTSRVPATRMERMDNLASLITYGSNIPLFIGVDPDREGVVSISFPNNKDEHWDNIFSPADVLGWPLGDLWNSKCGTNKNEYCGPKNPIEDRRMVVGRWWEPWARYTPWAHTAYDRDPNLLRLIAERIKSIL